MNKKFLSAILFGALMVTSTGTFVSCSDDYDDDIKHLQDQIDKLATKEDMTSQIASLQSALTAAQSDASAAKTSAEDALKKAQEALDNAGSDEVAKQAAQAATDAAQAKLDAANAKAEAVKAAQDEVATIKAELEAAIDEKFEASKNELAETIATLTKKVEELTGYSTDMLTGISFQTLNDEDATWYDANLDVNYARVASVSVPKGLVKNAARDSKNSYTFGENMPGAFTISSGDINTIPDYMLVNVDPVNSVVSDDMLSLINGQGVELGNYVDMTISNAYATIVKHRSAAGTGLRLVGVQLKKDVDFETFDKLVLAEDVHAQNSGGYCEGKHDYIAYALAVTDVSKSRTVTSPFDVTLHVQQERKAIDIERNSYIWSSASKYWDDYRFIIDYSHGRDEVAGGEEYCFPVKSKEEFYIQVGSSQGRVMASYVTVDYDNASLSATDKAAIRGITFEGTDIVLMGTNDPHAIKIDGSYVTGVVIPLKLVTIDYTGNVEVNVIWVKAGEDKVLSTINYTLTPTSYVEQGWNWDATNVALQPFTIPANTATYSVSLIVGETSHQSPYRPVTFTGDNYSISYTEFNLYGQNFLKLYKDTDKHAASKISEVAYAEFVGTLNLQLMKEDKAYEGVVKFYDANGTYLGTHNITVTKVLPTAVPADFSAKTNAINNGVLTIYPEPQPTNKKGEFFLKKAFNNWTEYYEFIVAGVTDSDLGAYNAGAFVGDNSTAKIYDINSGLINNGNSYATTVKYNYGDIVFHPEGHGTVDPDEYKVTWATAFSTKFGCVPVDSEYSWTNGDPTVYYRENTTIIGKISKDADGKVVGYTHAIKVLDPYGKAMDPFVTGATDGWSIWATPLATAPNAEIKLITNGDRVNEFFTAEYVDDTQGSYTKKAIRLTRTSTEVVLSGDVETTVVLVITDKFGHKHEVSALKFIMKKDHK